MTLREELQEKTKKAQKTKKKKFVAFLKTQCYKAAKAGYFDVHFHTSSLPRKLDCFTSEDIVDFARRNNLNYRNSESCGTVLSWYD